MTNYYNDKSGHEFKLPTILRKGSVFKLIAEPVKAEHQQYVVKYRKKVFSMLHEMLDEKDRASSSTYKKWFFDPERRLNKSFLENERKDPERWSRLITAMEYVLSTVVAEALEESRELSKLYTDRVNNMSDILNAYHKQAEESMPKKTFQFRTCDVCGTENSAIYRFWSKQNECTGCSKKSFKIWYTLIFGPVAIYLISLLF